MANSNVIPSRRYKEYEIDLPVEKKYMSSNKNSDRQIAYWEGIQTDEDKNAILLHGFTRTSKKMEKRAKIYWERGYNIYLIDNLGHGYSDDILFPSGYQYSKVLLHFIEYKNIEDPIVHGVSMGAIGAVFTDIIDPSKMKMMVCEALAYHFDDLYEELLRYLGIPYLLFPWLDFVSRKLVWKQWTELDIEYDMTQITHPMFLIHSKNDVLFKYQEHYLPIVNELEDRDNFRHWLVPDASHSDMDYHPEYEDKLIDYLNTYS